MGEIEESNSSLVLNCGSDSGGPAGTTTSTTTNNTNTTNTNTSSSSGMVLLQKLWSNDNDDDENENGIRVGDDGFLYVKNNISSCSGEGGGSSSSSSKEEEHEQPLLLHSTKELLQMLYPNQSMKFILNINKNCGHFDPQTEEPKLLELPLEPLATATETETAAKAVAGGEVVAVIGNEKEEEEDDDDGMDDTPNAEDDPKEGTDTAAAASNEEEEETEISKDNVVVDDEDVSNEKKEEETKNSEENNNNKKDNIVPKEYMIYQKLVRCPNISAKAQSALFDIRLFRNRSTKDRKQQQNQNNRENGGQKKLSWEQQKVRALEHQQQRILQQQSQQRTESTAGATTTTTSLSSSENESMDDDGDVIMADVVEEQQQQDKNDDVVVRDDVNNNNNEEESQHVRIVRTVNSVRALYPHLLPLLNHPRRSDKQLVINKTRYRQKHRETGRKETKNKRERKAMCWILGTHVFDITTGRYWKNIYGDAKILLQSFVPVQTADLIIGDKLGGGSITGYWTSQFLIDVKQRSQPQIINPLQILADHGPLSSDEAKEVAIRCDKDLCMHLTTSHNDTKSKIQKQYDRAVERLHQRLSNIFGRRFPKSRVSIYGSCLSNLSLGEGADVDISVWTPEADQLKNDFHEGKITASRYEKSIKDMAFAVSRKLKNMKHEFSDVHPVTRARVPVVKGRYNNADNPYSNDGSIHFDICFLNDIAVANSGLLRQYSLVDPRVRSLMMTVKQWAKEYNLNSAKDNYISSYAWVNLVIFYLQCLGYVPNLQNRQLMADVNVTPNPEGNYWHFVNKLDTCTLTWGEVNRAKAWSPPHDFHDLPISALLYGFFEFYGCRFPSAMFAVSIKEGTLKLFKFNQRKLNLFLCIEDPFETFDSHNPHDLGTPAGEKGAREIMKYLLEAECHLRKMLCGETEVSSLWPEPPFVDPHQSAGTHKKGEYSRFEPPKVPGTDDENKTTNPTTAHVPSKGRGGFFASNGTNKNKVSGKDGNHNANHPRGGGGGGGGRRGKPRHPRPAKQWSNHDSHRGNVKKEESTQNAGESSGQRHGGKQNRNQNRSWKGGHNESNRNIGHQPEHENGPTKNDNRNRNQHRRGGGKDKEQQAAEPSTN